MNFFGFGPLAQKEVMLAIIGKDDVQAAEIQLDGFVFGFQRLDQTPPEAQKVLEPVWGNKCEFSILVPGEGQVKGMVWTIDDSDLKLLKNWFMCDLGWTDMRESSALFIPVLAEGQEYTLGKIGDNYDPEKYVQIAKEVRREYYIRRGVEQNTSRIERR